VDGSGAKVKLVSPIKRYSSRKTAPVLDRDYWLVARRSLHPKIPCATRAQLMCDTGITNALAELAD
jgi:hypothetical protein